MTDDVPPTGEEILLIQQLQFRDLEQAQLRAAKWLRTVLRVDVTNVVLRPQPTSLNSFNGTATFDSRPLFFKSHTEPGGSIEEYYNSEILHDAGYNIVLPVHTEHGAGQQVALYPIITAPVMFDLMHRADYTPDSMAIDDLVTLQASENARLLAIYRNTAALSDPDDQSKAPVQQLFWNRLTGGRFDSFYTGRTGDFPGIGPTPLSTLFDTTWIINGVEQPRTLSELISEATIALSPHRPAQSVIGHGDAHFGNVFLDDGHFLYFDPAFAGRHSPLLDIAKPLFHNTFAQWMYYPYQFDRQVAIGATTDGTRILVDYDCLLTPLRRAFLDVFQNGLVGPVVDWVTEMQGGDRCDLRPLHLALMCCPLLTMNLMDRTKFSPSIGLLGLALAVQMGNWDVQQEFAATFSGDLIEL